MNKMRTGLKRKFLFLIIGIILIPLLSALLLFYIRYTSFLESENQEIGRMLIDRDYYLENRSTFDRMALNFFLENDIDLFILHDSTLSFSTMGLENGTFYTTEELLDQIEVLRNDRRILWDSWQGNDGLQIDIIVFLDTVSMVRAIQPRLNPGAFIFLLIIAFVVIMVLIILRSITNSMRFLQTATAKIADGDLDFQLTVKGRDEFALLATSFEQMRLALKEARENRARTLMSVSHDLKTPLSSIKGYAEAIQDNLAKTPEMRSKYAGVIFEKADLLQERISDLINYVKLETEEWRYSLKQLSALDFFSEISAEFKEECMVRGLHYREDLIISARAVLNLDAKLMRRALENLFDNALRYSGPEASVFFTASVINDEIQISLQDEGQGIDARDLENIFKPFFRADSGRNSKGFGLGLTNVKSIIENHGGRIEVQSQSGVGTTVIVYLPLSAYK